MYRPYQHPTKWVVTDIISTHDPPIRRKTTSLHLRFRSELGYSTDTAAKCILFSGTIVTISAFWMKFHKRAYTFLRLIPKLSLQAKLCLKDIYSGMFEDLFNNPTYHIDHSGKLPLAQLQTSDYQELWKLSCLKVTFCYLEENNKRAKRNEKNRAAMKRSQGRKHKHMLMQSLINNKNSNSLSKVKHQKIKKPN